MSRTRYSEKNGLKKGAWTKDEDSKLRAYIERYGHWNWSEIPKFAGVSRCGKSCRLRWMNYLRPDIKHGNFTEDEEDVIMELHSKIGNKWSTIASKLVGRSDNEIKNYWNTHLRKQVREDKRFSKNVYNENLESDQANPNENEAEKVDLKVTGEIKILAPTLSSESSFAHGSPYMIESVGSLSTSSSSSSSSANIELSSSLLSGLDCLTSSDDSVQPSCYEEVGNFWTEPFLPDYDSARSNEYSSCMDVANGLASQTSCHDMVISDEFLWSTMELYSEYHSRFIKKTSR